MNEPILTLCCVNHNCADAVALMWESYQRWHPDLPTLFYAWDNGSTDGALDYLRKHTHYLKENGKNDPYYGLGVGADALCKLVETPYTLLVDSDVEFRDEVCGKSIAIIRASAQGIIVNRLSMVTPCARASIGTQRLYDYMGNEVILQGQPRIDTCFALWHTDELRFLLDNGSSWVRYHSIDRGIFHDGGSMLYRDAKLVGMNFALSPRIWDSIHHYGEVAAIFTNFDGQLHDESEPSWIAKKAILRERYAEIGRRLELLRKGEI